MKRYSVLLAIASAALLVAPCAVQAQGEGDTARRMIGTWRMVANRYGDAREFTEIPKEKQTTFKHFVPGGTIWAEWEPETGKVINCAAGSWSAEGDTFTEKPIYGMGPKFDSIRGKEMRFTVTFEGDRWTQSGDLGGFKLAETWERVPGEASDDKELAGKLIGVWRLGEFRYDIPKEVTENPDLPLEGQTTVKFVGPTHFVWITAEPHSRKVTRCAGGTWLIRGRDCVEKVQHGLLADLERVRNQEVAYRCKVDADRWECMAEPGNGVKLAETWVRAWPVP